MSRQPSDVRRWPAESDLASERPTLEGSLTEAAFEALPTQIALLDDEGDIIHTNRAWRAFGEQNDITDPPDTIGDNYPAVCKGADDDHAQQAYEGLVAVLDGEQEAFAFEYPCHGPSEKRWFTMRALRFEHQREQFVLVLHLNITDRKRSELRANEQKETLETLNEVNTVVRDVVDSLLGEVSREEVEQAVCDRLVASELYDSACVLSRGLGGDSAKLRTVAGIEPDALAVDDLLDGGVYEAIETGEVQAYQYLGGNGDVPEPVLRYADATGYRAYAVVPLTYRETVYGTLVVNAHRPDALDEREREAFSLLGETVGYAINAIQSKRVLYADTLTELVFDVTDASEFLLRAARDTDAIIELEGVVPADEGVTGYFRVDGTDPAGIVELADARGLEDARGISGDEHGGLLECTLLAPSALVTLTEYGLNVVRAEVDDDGMRVAAVAAPETDVRSVVEELTENVAGTTLAAKRESDRTLSSTSGFRERLHEELTDRQRDILEAAYFGGYFEQPRESSGTELAETFGVSSPTFHQHLQAGLGKLTALAFDTAAE